MWLDCVAHQAGTDQLIDGMNIKISWSYDWIWAGTPHTTLPKLALERHQRAKQTFPTRIMINNYLKSISYFLVKQKKRLNLER